MARRRQIYPMPVEGLIYNPDFIAMPAAGRGILFSLVLHFWQTECRALPTADHELRNIGRAHAPTWRHWKAQVLKVFGDIRPTLEAYYSARENKAANLSRLGQRTVSLRKAAALRNVNALSDNIPVYASGFVPKREPVRPPRPPSPENRPPRKLMVDRPSW
jgi:hypothetical protein